MDALEATRRSDEEMKAMLKAVLKKQAEFDVCSNILFYIQVGLKAVKDPFFAIILIYPVPDVIAQHPTLQLVFSFLFLTILLLNNSRYLAGQ